jgi:hypothetical protein
LYAVFFLAPIPGILLGTIAMSWYGALDFIQHYTLRFILWWKGYAPWRYIRFLDHAADRIFLQRVGGGYIFVHRMMQDYFASLREDQLRKIGLKQ